MTFAWRATVTLHGITRFAPIIIQCSKLRVHPAPGVHILAARCMDLATCAPGVCMVFPTFR